MKVVRRKDGKITIGKLIDNFENYIVVVKKRGCVYILINWAGDFVWMNIKNNVIWDEFFNVSTALQGVNIKKLYVFKNYNDFANWLKRECKK